jgi:hypothetical protein
VGELPNSHGRTLTDKSYVLHGIPYVLIMHSTINLFLVIYKLRGLFVQKFFEIAAYHIYEGHLVG